MERRPWLSLTQLFVGGTLVVAAVAAAVFAFFLQGSRASVLEGANRVRASAARDVVGLVQQHFDKASDARHDVEQALRMQVAAVDTPLSLEPLLFTEVLGDDDIAEITFIHADITGWNDADDGAAVLAPTGRWALSVYRATADATSPILTRYVSQAGGAFVSDLRRRESGAPLLGEPLAREPSSAMDPTAPPTFQTTVLHRLFGVAIWSDLHWFELDLEKPEAERRVTLSLQQAVVDTAGKFLGVLRVAMRAEYVDTIAKLKVSPEDPSDPQAIFLCDEDGRLVTRVGPNDHLESMEGELRVVPVGLPPPIAAALASPLVAQADSDSGESTGTISVNGQPYVATFRVIENWRGWRIGIVAPEAYYTKDLLALRDRSIAAFGVLFVVALAMGGLALRALRRGLGAMGARTTNMRRFDFTAAPGRSSFKDIQQVIDGLERAKTVTRALGKYVPIDLVRRLFTENKDPALGGEVRTLSLMFTDIKDFTTLAERITPDALARALGLYLDAMTGAIVDTGGTIDKFIGDAVMAMWNAPEPCAGHEERACRAALACQAKLAALYASPAWKDLPPLVTRFGLHTADVMVGNFGSPARLSYTALGDGVNLASRLEGLCKQYDVTVLASDAIVERTRELYEYRLVDRVAVKGKSVAVRVYELLGEKAAPASQTSGNAAKLATARAYETAYEAYERRDFEGARKILATLGDDGPSRTLDARCCALLADPPPDDWDPVLHASSK